MNKEEAEMWADVARRLGLEDVYVEDEHGEGEVSTDATVYYTHEFAVGDGSTDRDWRDFDPPNNPADERMLWTFLEGDMEHFNYCVMIMADEVCLNDQPRVTALGLAVQGLPESKA